MSYPHFLPPANSTVYVPFATFDGGTGASITLTGLAVTDVEIYKNGSITQRTSDAGITLLDTDGIDFDGITGIHGFSIDLSDNTDAGFYVAGGSYFVVVSSVTVDAQTVNFVACSFRIMAAEGGAGVVGANTTHFGGSAGTFSGGIPAVNATQFSGDSTAADNAELYFDGTGYRDTDNLFIIRANTAQAGAAGTITLDASASASDDFYNNTLVFVYGGTGAGQARVITDYVGATKVASVGENWVTSPSSDSTFIIYPGGGAAVSANVTQWAGSSVATPTNAGVPEVDVTHWLGTAAATPTTAGIPEVDLTHIAGSAVSTTTAQLGVNIVSISGDSTSADNLESYTDGTTPIPANMTQVSGDSGAADNLETGFDDTAGAVRWLQIIDQGTAQSATGTTLVLRAAAAFADDEINGCYILITGGSAGVGQVRQITDYVSTTDTATVAAWTTTPTGTITYRILPQVVGAGGGVTAAEVADAVWDEATVGHTTSGTFGEQLKVDVDEILTDTGTTLQGEIDGVQADTEDIQTRLPAALVGGRIDATVDATGMEAGAVGAIADGVWEETLADHEETVGSTAEALATAGGSGASAADIADAVWDEAQAGHVGAGSFGEVATEVAAILVDTGTTLQGELDDLETDVAGLQTEIDGVQAIVEALQALLDNARGEPGQGSPPVNPDAVTKIDYLYKAWRNRQTQTASEYALYADNATTKDHEAVVSDDGTTFDRGEITTGA